MNSALKPALRRRRWLTPLRVILGLLFLVGFYYLTPLSNYLGWLTLDVAKLDRDIDNHMRRVHGDTRYACLYVVACNSGSARLDLTTSLTRYDIARLKSDIWRRRFEPYCEGATANIALEHSWDGQDYPPQDKYQFVGGGGFGGATGFGQGGSFDASGTAPHCTRDKAYWTREQGIVHGR